MTWKLRHLVKVRHLNFASGIGRECWTNFNGINELIDFGNTDQNLNVTRFDSIATSSWIYIPNHNGANVISRYEGFSTFRGWNMSISATAPTLTKLTWACNHTLINRLQVASVDPVPLNQWVHVGAYYPGVPNGVGTKLYFNGLPTASNVVANSLTSIITDPNSILAVGGNTAGLFGKFEGRQNNPAVFLGPQADPDALMATIFSRGRLNPYYNDLPGIYFHSHLDRLNPPDELSSNNGTSVNMDLTNITCTA